MRLRYREVVVVRPRQCKQQSGRIDHERHWTALSYLLAGSLTPALVRLGKAWLIMCAITQSSLASHVLGARM